MLDDEIDTLNRLVIIFLETAELRAKNRQDITTRFWRHNVDRILEFSDKKILQNAGTISNAEMEVRVEEIYKSFDKTRREWDALQQEIQDLEELEGEIKSKKKKNADG